MVTHLMQHRARSPSRLESERSRPSGKSILVIEDEEDILELLRLNLNRAGYMVFGATDGEEGMRILRREEISLVILDLMLPGISGLDILKKLRSEPTWRNLPVIILSARGEESDVVLGLELGADDYVTKPFSPKVLVARVRILLTRKEAHPRFSEEPIRCGNLFLHPGKHEVRLGNKSLPLTPSEFSLLHLLMRKPGFVFTRKQILATIRGEERNLTERLVDTFVLGLRKKLGSQAHLIEAVRGVGYRLRDIDTPVK